MVNDLVVVLIDPGEVQLKIKHPESNVFLRIVDGYRLQVS